MLKKLVAMAILGATLVSCGSTAGGRVDRRSVQMGDLRIGWADFAKISSLHKEAFGMPSGQSIYMFTRLNSAGQAGDATFNQFLELSEQAVARDGNCDWLGYDRGLDLAVRSTGHLASASDERLFFTKLSCR